MNKKIYALLAIIVLITIFNLSLVYFVFQYKNLPRPDITNLNVSDILPDLTGSMETVQKFTSADDFKEYLAKAPADINNYAIKSLAPTATDNMNMGQLAGLGEATSAVPGTPDRISGTNVQVAGIDEMDIVKTDGKEIYFSSPSFWLATDILKEMPVTSSDTGVSTEKISAQGESFIAPIMPPRNYGVTKTIKAWPVADLKLDANIDRQGELLLDNGILMVFGNNLITGYDVTDPAKPQEKWKVELDNRSWLETARLYKNTVYLVTKSGVNYPQPCPYVPLKYNGQELSIACSDIYHPVVNVATDSIYNIMTLDPKTGEIGKKTAFVASSNGNSVVYMSNNALYVTYTYPGDMIKFVLNFFNENKDLVPNWLITKLNTLQTYDLSYNTKMTEFGTLMQQWLNSLNQDEMLKLQNDLTNKMTDYTQKHNRELEQSGIAKIDIGSLEVKATGAVPGVPLNQFSLDENNNNLRIATTVGRWGFGYWFGFGSSQGQSVSDVYVLDDNLKVKGSVTDLGKGERIYSVRFIDNKGYVVTFKETDPFYVLDLSNASKPELKGELKIPGYSAYLHPLSKDLILGVGKEDQNVKLSIFNVSDPAKPTEVAKYILQEYWTDILNTHHAFLQDEKHSVFFMPGSQGGYIFSYADNKLELKKAVSNINSRRAVYLNDYLYIIGEDKIVVLNEKDWQEVNKLVF